MSNHSPRYSRNFADNTVSAFCDCGWRSVEDNEPEAVQAWRDHVYSLKAAESAKNTVVPLSVVGPTKEDKDAANYFRELADRIDAGDIGNIVVVFNDKEGNHFERFGNWRDRWHMLGAIEYAKFVVDRPD